MVGEAEVVAKPDDGRELRRGSQIVCHRMRDYLPNLPGITSWVWVTIAASLPSLARVIRVCHTMVVRPLCKARAFGARGIADIDGGEEIRLAFDRGRRGTFRQIHDGRGASQVIRERHHRAAMHVAVAIAEFGPHRKLGLDPVRLAADHLDAKRVGERRLDVLAHGRP